MERGSGLVIVQEENKWKLNIKKEYGELATKLIGSSEFDNPTTKTLAVIAYKQPVLQSAIIKIRGNKAYDHVKVLLERELITSEKHGRTRLLKLTHKFYDYFDTAEEKVKEMFKSVSEKMERKENVKDDVREGEESSLLEDNEVTAEGGSEDSGDSSAVVEKASEEQKKMEEGSERSERGLGNGNGKNL